MEDPGKPPAAMDYRLYMIGQDGHIIKAINLTCVDDGKAVDAATDIVNGAAAELWCRGRFIAKWTLPK